jgi:proteasome lid subunit RPN8/RPN11
MSCDYDFVDLFPFVAMKMTQMPDVWQCTENQGHVLDLVHSLPPHPMDLHQSERQIAKTHTFWQSVSVKMGRWVT